MTTTYLLHGGNSSQDTVANHLFFAKFTQLVPSIQVRIALCYWARNRERWDELAERDTQFIRRETTKEISIFVPENPEELKNKMSDLDVVYIAGGSEENIEPLFSELSWLKEELQGKVYIGSSMGAFLASSSYVLSFETQRPHIMRKGANFLDLNITAHWDQETDQQAILNLLKNNSKLPILTLDEGQSIRFISD